MLILDELKAASDAVFEADELKIPEPSIRWKDCLDELEKQELQQQYERCLFDMRVEQAKMMGFPAITSAEAVEMLMGEPHTNEEEKASRQNHEWFYNHHTGKLLMGSECNWGGEPTDFYMFRKEGPWWVPPFAKREVWRCRWGKLDYLERKIPYGVLLRINELKELKMFNAFSVVAPIEAWQHQTDIDPVVVGSIWELPKNEEGRFSKAGDTQHFFIAQW